MPFPDPSAHTEQLDVENTKISVPTSDIITNADAVDSLNNLSTHIENEVESGLTTWHFNEASKALSAILHLQGLENVGFRWVTSDNTRLIISYQM